MSANNAKPLAARARVTLLENMTIAVLGYGTQGRAHALNLRDAGCRVIVAQRKGGAGYTDATESGFEPMEIEAAVEAADLLIFGLPDEAAPAVYERHIGPKLRSGHTLGFMHGFSIHYRQIVPPADVDVVLVAPRGRDGPSATNSSPAGVSPPSSRCTRTPPAVLWTRRWAGRRALAPIEPN